MHIRTIALALLATVSMAAAAQDQKPANEQVIVPQVERRELKLPRFPSKDFELGVFTGTYATQNFGASWVNGLRLGYHISEDIFVEAVYAQTQVSDESFRQVLPGGVFADKKETLKYYNLSAGFNVLPGEVFIGSKRAKATSIYLIGGVGSTNFNQQRRQTVNFGLGTRLLLADRWALQVDMRDHVFSLDLLGKRQSTQNLELTGGLTFFF
ncbi:outer membrane beta-barrel domain-containing protein [Piscinibacter sp.]|jgi:outer membrane beta-barrel protein|uniref:outer membrane beta-barrel domain-containing protein n=1 Tax=Piscinibacter sp. TaxID=1903157 RepID=UPI002F410F9A